MLAFFSLGVFAAVMTALLGSDNSSSATVVTAVVSFSVAAVILWREGMSDTEATLTFLATIFSGLATCMLIYLFYASSPGATAKSVGFGSLIVAIGLWIALLRFKRAPESSDFPNILLEFNQSDSVYESEGVQFTASLDPGSSQRPHKISIFLQNCFNHSRDVTINFDGASQANYMRFFPYHQLRVGPAEVIKVMLPVVTPTYPGNYNLFFSIAVSGSGGKRVRRWRAKEQTKRVTKGAQLALLAVGMLAWGGGISFTVGPLSEDIWANDLPLPSQEIVWQPRPGTVPFH